MARTPEGATLIPNRVSGAPGIRVGNVFIMAGVPHITAGMLDALTGNPRRRPPGGVGYDRFAGSARAKSQSCCARPKSRMRAWRSAAIPFFREGRTGANFVIRSPDAERVDACLKDLTDALQADGRDVIAGGI